MNDEQLDQLLQRADATAGPPPTPLADLAGAVRRVVRRRRARRVTFVSTAAAIVLATGAIAVANRGGAPAPTVPDAVTQRDEQMSREIARLQAQADELLASLDRLERAMNSPTPLPPSRRQPDAFERISREIEAAARTLVFQADCYQYELNSREKAISGYQEVTRLFPETAWAQIARERLGELAREDNAGDGL